MTERTMTTWRPVAPSDDFFGLGFITSLDGWFDDVDEPVELIEEVWELVSIRTVRVGGQCSEVGCDADATHWGLCEAHAREDDPQAFEGPEERMSE